VGLDGEEGVREAGARVSVSVGGTGRRVGILEPWELESERHGGDGGGRESRRRESLPGAARARHGEEEEEEERKKVPFMGSLRANVFGPFSKMLVAS